MLVGVTRRYVLYNRDEQPFAQSFKSLVRDLDITLTRALSKNIFVLLKVYNF